MEDGTTIQLHANVIFLLVNVLILVLVIHNLLVDNSMLRYFKIFFYVNSHIDKIFEKRKRSAISSLWVSLCRGTIGVR
jgi:hypothetical protein